MMFLLRKRFNNVQKIEVRSLITSLRPLLSEVVEEVMGKDTFLKLKNSISKK